MTIALRDGPARLVLDPDDGARVVSLVVAERERLVTTPPDLPGSAFQWGCFVMAPFAGRIRDAAFTWEGRTVRLVPRVQGNALHGLVAGRPWDVDRHHGNAARLSCRLDDAPWPWSGALVTHELALGRGRLDLALAITAGPHPAPAWLGWHPCFRRPDHGDVAITVPADHVLEVDDRTVPTGAVVPVAGATDLRDGPALGDRRLDDTFIALAGAATVAWPDLVLRLAGGPGVDTAVVFTPAHLFCVEPQSGWPDAVHLAARHGDRAGARRLEPGETLRVTTTWTWAARAT